MSDLPTILAVLEEAEQAATPGPWRQGQPDMTKVHPDWVDAAGNSSDDCFHRNGFAKTIAVCKDPDFDIYDARLIALMRNSLPTLIEAVKQQGEALEIYDKCADDCVNHAMFSDKQAVVDAIERAHRSSRAALTAHKDKSDEA